MTSVGCIGGGRVTRILLAGWEHAGRMPDCVVVSDPNADSLKALEKRFPGIHAMPNGNHDAAQQDVVFIAVYPPAAAGVLAEIVPVLHPSTIVVSLMPKLSIAQIGSSLNGFNRVVRMIPNAPSIVGKGYNPMALDLSLPKQDSERIRSLVNPLGACPIVPEEQLEAYAVLTAMGPTYLWFQLYELQTIGVSFGLAEAAAAEGVRAMADGAVALMAESGLQPADVMDLVPVKPLGNDEASIRECYGKRLKGMYAKLKG
jgi:pyrroline-5-carboxylate reductase